MRWPTEPWLVRSVLDCDNPSCQLANLTIWVAQSMIARRELQDGVDAAEGAVEDASWKSLVRMIVPPKDHSIAVWIQWQVLVAGFVLAVDHTSQTKGSNCSWIAFDTNLSRKANQAFLLVARLKHPCTNPFMTRIDGSGFWDQHIVAPGAVQHTSGEGNVDYARHVSWDLPVRCTKQTSV